MDYAQYVVPPEPRVTERRVLVRPKMRRAVQFSVTTGVLALSALVVSAPAAGVLAGLGALGGVAAVVFRFTEVRRAVFVRRLEWPRAAARGSILHFHAGQ